ncbi:hypothetical protein [Sphingomicrobium sediminis]|uniref:Lipoprotein n=1 Tax=Sphingomicrobium sediminis TaxID=2950949 RepID=A0A9X2EFR9_9SPHN|nr:hypothetical protein [Sphingomicrobium sediminis]MCM8557175.1 hypothetical protein [Sphingomicrobium sediminis]
MRRLALLAAALVLAGCGGDEPCGDGAPQCLPDEPEAPVDDLPHLILYKSAEDGGPEAFMEALIGGKLDLSGPCVAIRTGGSEGRSVIVTTEGVVKRNDYGPYLEVGPHSFRDGDDIMSGGGFMGDYPQDESFLQEPIPEACKGDPKVQLSMIYPMPPEEAPVFNPPPPTDTIS